MRHRISGNPSPHVDGAVAHVVCPQVAALAPVTAQLAALHFLRANAFFRHSQVILHQFIVLHAGRAAGLVVAHLIILLQGKDYAALISANGL